MDSGVAISTHEINAHKGAGRLQMHIRLGTPIAAGNLKMGPGRRISPRPKSADRVGIFVAKSGVVGVRKTSRWVGFPGNKFQKTQKNRQIPISARNFPVSESGELSGVLAVSRCCGF